MTRTLFEKSRSGRPGFALPDAAGDARPRISAAKLRKTPPGLPELSELALQRHFVALSASNHSIARGFYPLGSCTMKYNPVVNETIASLSGFAGCHPSQGQSTVQGNLELLYRLEQALAAITGFPAFSLQSVAGAQGEFAGMRIARAWHESRGERRSKVIIPDSAHGTNPASVRMAGLETVTIASNDEGLVDLDILAEALGEDTAAVMLTNPNTLGLFEKDILAISALVHEQGGLLYMDGANMNALTGRVRPADLGFDIMHLNLHKTFATPHGGGGPGAGPVGVTEILAPFLPGPSVTRDGDEYSLNDREQGTGDVHGHFGNFAILVRALAYILSCGGDGLRDVSGAAVLNANYLKRQLADVLDVPAEGLCMHEFVADGSGFKEFGVKTLDLAKRMLDFGIHAPTVYFPLIVPDALMIEPTETEDLDSLDHFISVMRRIAKEAVTDPETLLSAPHTTPVSRLDEAGAARRLQVVHPLDEQDDGVGS